VGERRRGCPRPRMLGNAWSVHRVYQGLTRSSWDRILSAAPDAVGRGAATTDVREEDNAQLRRDWRLRPPWASRRFANATCAEELLGKAEQRLTRLDPYIDLVNQRWKEPAHARCDLLVALTGGV
jgi:hypothetical protein